MLSDNNKSGALSNFDDDKKEQHVGTKVNFSFSFFCEYFCIEGFNTIACRYNHIIHYKIYFGTLRAIMTQAPAPVQTIFCNVSAH